MYILQVIATVKRDLQKVWTKLKKVVVPSGDTKDELRNWYTYTRVRVCVCVCVSVCAYVYACVLYICLQT